MTTITVTPADVGTIVASNGVLTDIQVPTLPDDRWGFAPGPFTLMEAGAPNPRRFFNIESDNIGIVMGEIMCRQQHSGIGYGPLMSTYPIAFSQLMVAVCRRGAVIELMVN
jgi:hypothetical protein